MVPIGLLLACGGASLLLGWLLYTDLRIRREERANPSIEPSRRWITNGFSFRTRDWPGLTVIYDADSDAWVPFTDEVFADIKSHKKLWGHYHRRQDSFWRVWLEGICLAAVLLPLLPALVGWIGPHPAVIGLTIGGIVGLWLIVHGDGDSYLEPGCN